MRLKTSPVWRKSSRTTIKPGSVVRFAGGGPEYVGADGVVHRFRLPGRYVVREVLRAGQRYFLEVSGMDRTSGTFTVFVSGRAYRRKWSTVTNRPYKVKTKRAKRVSPQRELF